MKLFKKFSSMVLSFGMICSSAFAINPPYEVWDSEWDDEVFSVIASHTPKNLDECCFALDDALRNKPEIKEKIKNSLDDDIGSYIRHISCISMRVGYRISHYWLDLPEPARGPSPLAGLFYAHGADFNGEGYNVMSNMIFQNYRYYLNNGKSVDSIEDLAINFWFVLHHNFVPNVKREFYQERMQRWKQAKKSHRSLGVPYNNRGMKHNKQSCTCTLL